LKAWIASGADFNKSVTESNQLAELQKILFGNESKSLADVPEGNPEAANQNAVNELQQVGAVVLPVADESNYLSVNLVNVTEINSAIDLLVRLNQQVVWLKAGDLQITDSHVNQLAQLNQLTKLNLERTGITDAGLSKLNSLTNLQYLNLNQTEVTTNGISSLKSLKNLRSLYIYGTFVAAEELPTLQAMFPNTKIELGNYVVPLLESDTTILK